MRSGFRGLLLGGFLMVGFLGCGNSDTSSSTGTLVLTSRSLSDLSSSLLGNLAHHESALSSFKFTVKELHLSIDGSSWVEVYNDETGAVVDILSTSTDSAFSASVATGTYSYVALKVSSSISYQRAGEDCTEEQNFSVGEEDIMSVITTEAIFSSEEYGQEPDGSGGYTAPTNAPSTVFEDANDEMFWVLSEAITVSEGATATLALSAVTASLSEEECDEDPGKPVFSLVPVSE